MSLRTRWLSAGVVAALVAVVIPFGARVGATTPPWEPDPNSEGSLTFYNASGAVVTSGTNLGHLFDYAAASTAGRSGTIKATMFIGFPDHTKADSSTWFSSQVSASTAYPNTAAPAPINGLHNPVVSLKSSDGNLASLLSTTTLDTTAGYANLVQIRVFDSGPGIGLLTTPFWETDISFNQSAGTWAQVYPAPASGPTATTTTLGVSPASPQPTGTPVTLTATVAPAAAGTVQFKDGTANLGSAVTVSGGTASTSSSTLAAGTHSFTAVFTPTDPTAFSASTSTAKSYTITTPAATTSTTLAVTPPSPITAPTPSTLTATVSPTTAAGTVEFFDGATSLGVVAVASGTAAKTETFPANTHMLKAVFTPTDTNAFQGSQSAVQSYVVNAQAATPTTTALAVTQSSPQPFGTTLNLTGTVSPTNAVGNIQFLDGTTVLATTAVSGGTALATTSALHAGSHSLTAMFVPTNSSAFASSQSTPAKSFTITALSTSTTLGVSPSGPVHFGDSVKLTATVSPTAAPGAVTFFDGTTQIGTPVTVAAGSASLTTTTLSVATHSLTAHFAPTSTDYTGSTSTPASLQVQGGPTATTLTVTPSGGLAVAGTVETLAATVAPAATGSIQFFDGTTNIGAAVPVSGGSASTTTTLGVGSHTLSAQFTSTDPSYNGSTSTSQTFVVKQPVATTTTLAVSPAGPVAYGTDVTLTATLNPSGAVGNVSFFDGTTTLGTKAVSGGTASLTTIGIGGGTHMLSAAFTPTSSTDFASSSSNAVSLTVNAATTTTTLSVKPAGPVGQGKSVTLTATVSPATAAGSVTFRNHSTSLGTVTVAQGKATLTTTKLPVGNASMTASFAANQAADYVPSTSAAVTLQVVGGPVISGLSSNGTPLLNGQALHPGQVITVSASGFMPGDLVTVQVHSAPMTIGTVHASSTGTLNLTFRLPTTLQPGSHTLSLIASTGTVTYAFTIAGADPSSSGNLAVTGFAIAGGTTLGLLLIVVGGAAAGLGGPRRRHLGSHRLP